MTDTSPKSSPKSSAKAELDYADRRPRKWLRGAAVLLAFAVGFGAADAYVRIQINGKSLQWANPSLNWRLNANGSDNITDDSHIAAIEHGFQAWEDISGSNIAFTRGADTNDVAPGASSHIVAFDENNTSGYFPNGSGIVAITPISFDTGSGNILDADILFNGSQYDFSTDGSAGTFDVQDVLSHEIGHFIGLDHSPQISGTLWPYVSSRQWLHRSLTTDDRSGAIAVAPSGSQSRLTGSVRRDSDNSVIRGAIVSAISSADGRLIGMAATTSTGAFTIRGVPAGSYWLHVTPLEGGMTSGNLTGNSPVDTDFAADFYGSFNVPTSFNVTQGNETAAGTVYMDADIAMKDSANAAVITRRGDAVMVTIFGSNFVADQMDVISKSPNISISNVTSASSFVRATVTVNGVADLGSYDLYIRHSGGDFDVASGIIEVVLDPPTIVGLDTTTGSIAGGEEVTITGTNFQNGAYVLFGGLEAETVSFVNSTTLTVTTPAVAAGIVDVAVHNGDGQQVTSDSAFTYQGTAVYTSMLPKVGNIDGGTKVYIVGDNFSPQTQVLFDGEVGNVTYKTSTILQVTTPAHAAGQVNMILRNLNSPDRVVNNVFTYVTDKDPKITSFTPGQGPKGGGTLVRIYGSNLKNIASVRFGVDPVSGQGGKLGNALNSINKGEVRSRTRLNSNAGSYGILVTTETGQAAMVTGYTFESDGSAGGSGASLGAGGGGGGGCSARLDQSGMNDWRVEVPGWMLLFGGAWLQRRRQRRKLAIAVVRVD
ncbi:MAG: matrixin family metalloprotease [Planctomycetes bacterium]|nr:matrixin family metalloprotease [Planctomycetota bacterium]MCP4770999.1 matrixin family metalloprotease [Planctomycetota bacterium]MCP4861718.1 matrixin family metalloprotease [Planctomycetota bacterium]